MAKKIDENPVVEFLAALSRATNENKLGWTQHAPDHLFAELAEGYSVDITESPGPEGHPDFVVTLIYGRPEGVGVATLRLRDIAKYEQRLRELATHVEDSIVTPFPYVFLVDLWTKARASMESGVGHVARANKHLKTLLDE